MDGPAGSGKSTVARAL
ncbi:MAG: (d)CMP kinase, partial [Candidatus Brocadiales bacterium]|nr:(d)CMP kinase [Candidatus Bathyanammoxibius sp.]